MDTEPSLQDMIERTAAESARFVSGDPDGMVALLSPADDVSIFGGFGAGVVGHDEMVRRLGWAAARFAGGDITYELMTSGSSGDLGYAVGIERGHVTLAGHDEPEELALRVTHVFRREQGVWRIVHRHADPVVAVTPPEGVLADS
ncbi:YybH family protein [Actinomycetospora sp. C-140]